MILHDTIHNKCSLIWELSNMSQAGNVIDIKCNYENKSHYPLNKGSDRGFGVTGVTEPGQVGMSEERSYHMKVLHEIRYVIFRIFR